VKRLAELAARRLQRGDGRREAIAALEAEFREAFVSFRWRDTRHLADELWTMDADRRRTAQFDAAVARLSAIIERRMAQP
jgi:hypothetical protein